MDLFDQIKTSQGRLPVIGAHVVREKGEVRFDVASPVAIASGEVPTEAKGASVEKLAVIDSLDGLEGFARDSGPLFGMNEAEPISDWEEAIVIAKTVLVLQGFVNSGGMVDLDESAVKKLEVTSSQSDVGFLIYSLEFRLERCGTSSLYLNLMPSDPIVRKFVGMDCYDYAVVWLQNKDEKYVWLSSVLLSFDEEITPNDYAVVQSYFEDHAKDVPKETLRDGLMGQHRGADEWSDDILAPNRTDYTYCSVSIGSRDVAHIQNLVHVLTWLHLRQISIDVFRPNEDNEFLIFDSYLNYLWYGFSRTLKQVKVGFCQQCHKEFSLTHHRGIPRKFCSERCKTKEKNERTRRARDKARKFFASGESVESIASTLYPKDDRSVGVKRVVANLRNWKVLQRDVDAALLALPGFDRKVIERYMNEGVFSLDDIEQRRRALKTSSHLVQEARRHAEAKAAGREMQ